MDDDDAPRAASYNDFEGSVPHGSGQADDASFHSSREKRLREENIGLKGQLDSARAIIEGVAKGAVPDESKKRLRIGTAGSDRAGSSLSALEGDDDKGSHHPATLRAERLRVELEEQRVLREQDKLRFEVLLREADSTKGKLLRQVKFLSQEEEQTREECDKKQAAFLAEMARLQESLSSARAALAGAKAEDDEMGQQERQAFERRLEREVTGRRMAQEKKREFKRQAEECAEELSELRRLRRVADAKNVSLSLEVAKLKRDALAGALPVQDTSVAAAETLVKEEEGLSPDWDTPVARELRGKIRTLEREARKREAVLKALEDDRRNAIALEDEVQTLQGGLQRSQEALKSALEVQAEHSAIRDEKEEWSLLFSRAVREETAASRFKLKADGGGGGGEGGGEAGDAGPRPTPLVALRLLREIQEQRSLAVKELTALRVRQDNTQRCLVQVELELKKEKERADSLHVRAEELQSEFDKLERRCHSAEREVVAQKDVIESYERDNFRKPADETWLSGHASLQAALAAAKDEVNALREAAEGQVSALEAGRLRDRAAEADAALSVVTKERDQAMKAAEQYGDKLAVLAKEAATGTGASTGKVLHFKDNPWARAVESAKKSLKEQLEALKEDNKRLVHQLEQAGPGAVDASMSTVEGGSILGGSGIRGADTPDANKFSLRLKETYRERINYYREAVYLLTG